MEKIKIHTQYLNLPADLLTPVSIYLKVRDRYANAILLESSDYHTSENSYSFICFDPIAEISVSKNHIHTKYPDQSAYSKKINKKTDLPDAIEAFKAVFDTAQLHLKFPGNGLFGYSTYDSVCYSEDISFNGEPAISIPDVLYSMYRFVIVINHFHSELYLFCHDTDEKSIPLRLDAVTSLLSNTSNALFSFEARGEECSNMSDAEFRNLVAQAKVHCQRGDVFQIVLSRAFTREFRGDEFNVYRALRRVNPSPYLFYFDYGSFRLFGSSPEAQLVIQNNIAEVHPIAGTVKRTGNDEADLAATEKLKTDKKENAEHIMLVDLARNDLSRSCTNVEVKNFREVHFYSHVIHLVSKVTGRLKKNARAYEVMTGSFPAGTLSGAPKHKAMQLINRYEKDKRGFYGGCIGFMGFSNSFNHAIMIRTFLSANNRLHYRAGAGIVVNSIEENELQEINNKAGALRKAIAMAEGNNNYSSQEKTTAHELINY